MAPTSGDGSDEQHIEVRPFPFIAKSIGLTAFAAAVPWTLSLMVPGHRARLRSLTATAATCSALGSLAHGISSFRNRYHEAAATDNSTECPSPREAHKRFGLKDGVVLGGLATILVLGRLPTRSPLFRYNLAAPICGLAGAFLAHRIIEARSDGDLRRNLQAAAGLESIPFADLPATMQAMLSMSAEDAMLQPAGGTVVAFWEPPDSSPRHDSGSSGRGSSPGGASQPSKPSSESETYTIDEGNVPLGISLGAGTNYDWNSKTPVADIEKQLEVLTERRAQLSREAVLLYSWLSQEELEYFNRYSKLPDSPEKWHHRRYLQYLGRVHFMLWQQAAVTDWCIANAKQHLARLRSFDASGKMTWHIEKPSSAALIKPERSMEHLRILEQALAKEQTQVQELKRNMAEMLLGFDEETQDEQIYDPAKKKMISQKEMFAELRAEVERHAEVLERDQRVVRQVIVDAEKR